LTRRQYGLPDADGYQGKVEIRLDDIAVPVIGYRMAPKSGYRFSEKAMR